MHRLGTGFMGFWTHVPLEAEAEYVRFLADEHMPERLRLPGFSAVRLFASLAPPTVRGRRYMALYETESLQVLTNPAYLERLGNPTGWTRSFMPKLSGSERGAGTSLASLGHAGGGFAAIVRVNAVPSDLPGLRLGELMRRPDVIGLRLLAADEAASSVKTPGTAREGPRLTFRTLAIAEADAAQAAKAGADAIAALLPPETVDAPNSFRHDYRLAFAIHRRDLD